MTKIEVIVPVYNNEKYIGKCLKSLLNQTIEDLKIIVVNDGSNDNTEKIVMDLIRKYPNKIRYYYKKNGGIAETRNFGIEKVEADYFGFLDSDDFVNENMYQKMYDKIVFEKTDICMCDFYWEYPNKRKLAKEGPYINTSDLISKMFATLWNKLYRTSWVKEKTIIFPNGLHYEDASFLYRLAVHMDKVSYINEPLVHYVQREGSITHTFKVNIQDMIDVFKGIKDYYIDNDLFDEYYYEIEYLFIRFFLGNSYLRAVRIKNKSLRLETLNKSWNFLNNNFPTWKKNKFINNGGKKNFYFRILNKKTYYLNSYIFRFIYKIGFME